MRYLIEHDGRQETLKAWSRLSGIAYHTLKYRWQRGARPPELFHDTCVLTPRLSAVANGIVLKPGARVGNLKLLTRVPAPAKAQGASLARWLCRCSCGCRALVWQGNLTAGLTRSCGCMSMMHRHPLTLKGRTLTVHQWALETEIPPTVIMQRIRSGMPAASVLDPTKDIFENLKPAKSALETVKYTVGRKKLTAPEIAKSSDVCVTTVREWARDGNLSRHRNSRPTWKVPCAIAGHYMTQAEAARRIGCTIKVIHQSLKGGVSLDTLAVKLSEQRPTNP